MEKKPKKRVRKATASQADRWAKLHGKYFESEVRRVAGRVGTQAAREAVAEGIEAAARRAGSIQFLEPARERDLVRGCVDHVVRRGPRGDRADPALRKELFDPSGQKRGDRVSAVPNVEHEEGEQEDEQENDDTDAIFFVLVGRRSARDPRLSRDVRHAALLRDRILAAHNADDHEQVARLVRETREWVRSRTASSRGDSSALLRKLGRVAGEQVARGRLGDRRSHPQRRWVRRKPTGPTFRPDDQATSGLPAYTELMVATRSAAEGFYRALRRVASTAANAATLVSGFREIHAQRDRVASDPIIFIQHDRFLDKLWQNARAVRWALPEYLEVMPRRRGTKAEKGARRVRTVVLCGGIPVAHLRKLRERDVLDPQVVKMLLDVAEKEPSRRAGIERMLDEETHRYGPAAPPPPADYKAGADSDIVVDLLDGQIVETLYARGRGARWAAARFVARLFFRHEQRCFTQAPPTFPDDPPWRKHVFELLATS